MTVEEIYQLFISHPAISTDSRKIKADSLFFALKGDNFDGNSYALTALETGAYRAIVDDYAVAADERFILVNDVLKTLQDIATRHRQQLKIPVIAITGTNGKTTTKELVAAVLMQKFNTHFTRGNLNNHIGVPLTLLSFTRETEIGVVEMGANHPGEIDFLCRIAQPDYGLITNVGKAHLEGFGSFEGVIRTKTEMYRFLEQKNGRIFINGNNDYLTQNAGTGLKQIMYGTTDGFFQKAELVDSPPYVNLKAWFPSGVLYINTKLVGNYNFENVLAAITIGRFFGVDPLKIQSAIAAYLPSNNRSQWIKTERNEIIMDAYNANPTSMQASLLNFFQLQQTNKTLILGDMLELGAVSAEEHQRIVDYVNNQPGVKVFLVGKQFEETCKPLSFKSFRSTDQLEVYLKENPLENEIILIKGSRGIQLEKLINTIS